MSINMKLDSVGYSFLKEHEGEGLYSYVDSTGNPTIGYGHKFTPNELKTGIIIIDGQSVDYSGGITSKQQDTLFVQDVQPRVDTVNNLVNVNVTQNQFNALVSFEFNTGNLSGSSLLNDLNAGNLGAVEKDFMKWVKGENPKDPSGPLITYEGLVNRRTAEVEMYGGLYQTVNQVGDSTNLVKTDQGATVIQPATIQSVPEKIDIESRDYMAIKLVKGDSIEALAKAFGTTPDKITDEKGNVITGSRETGSFVMVPYTYNWRGISSYTVQEGDNWTKIATRTGISEDKLRTMSGNKGIGDQFDPGISISFFKENSSYHYANGDIVDQSWYAIANHSTQNVQNTSANDSADIRKTQYDNMINDITYSRGDAVEMAKRINYYNETGKLDECRGFGFDVDGKLQELLRDHYSNVKDDIAKGDTTDGVEEKINEYKKNGELKAFKAAGFYVDTDLSIIRNAAHTTNVQNGDERDMRRGGSSSQNPMASLSAKTNTPHKFQSALELMQASIKFTNQCIAAREEQNTQSLGQGQSLGYSRGASRC